MLATTAPSYIEVMTRLNSINPSAIATVVHNHFAKALVGNQLTSEQVVMAWRNAGVYAMQMRVITFTKWVQIDANYESYMNSIYDFYPEFAAEVIRLKNYDFTKPANHPNNEGL